MKRISVWWRAMRPFSFTVSVIPPILGALIALIENPGLNFQWLRFVLTSLGCMLAHAGANMLSDYFDFKRGVDRPGTYGSSGVLVGKLMEPEEILRGVIVAYLFAGLIGLYLIFTTPGGMILFFIVLVGGVFGVFYTLRPLAFKYRALGDIAVFVSFGSAMTLGAYYVQAHRFSWGPIVYALPIAFLVDAILHGNNLRDIHNDCMVRIKTVPILIGEGRAKEMYYGLVLGAYGLIPILVLFAGLPWISLATWVSLPLALKLVKMVKQKQHVPEGSFAMIDAATAQLHSAFGILLIISLLLQHLLFARPG